MLPLGVVIPTKNSRPYLPAHLDGLQSWLDQAEEVVVVDSFSTDGTVEYLRENLAHPRVTYLTHPPGLYASWNHGIAHIRSRYVFIATSGDWITLPGLEQLLRAAETLACDVVISKPTFRDPSGQALPDILWPIDDIITTLELTSPRKLNKLEALIFAVAHATGALLGSSASNVFRTEMLRRFPFPSDFGTAGDGAWGLLHAPEVSWGVVPGKFSTFLIHPTNASAEEKKSFREARRPDAVLRTALESWRRSGTLTDQDLACAGWHDLLASLASYLDAKTAFDQNRRGPVPWILNPRAWQNRMKRGHSSQQFHQLKRQALIRCSAISSSSPCLSAP
jgi:glycosyltransferase involved in cell wall biosynthesis